MRRDAADAAYKLAGAAKDAFGIKKITRPVDQRATCSFHIIDADANRWKILTNRGRRTD